MKKRFIAMLLTGCLLLALTGCSTRPRRLKSEPEPRTIVNTDTLQITAAGPRTAVHDIAGDARYNFTTRRKRKSEGAQGPRTAVNTDTVQITLDGATLIVLDKSTGTRYTVRRDHKQLHN